MKIELVKKGDQYFLRGYFLGFIPMYYDDYSGDNGWWFSKAYISKERGLALLQEWKYQTSERKEYKKSKEEIITSI